MRKRLLVVLGIFVVLVIASCGKKTQDIDVTTTAPTEETTTETATETETTSLGENVIEIYKSNDDASGLVEETVELTEISAESIIEEFKKAGILSEETKVLSFEVKDKIATLNLSAVPSTGTAGESVMLGAIGNTFTKAFQVDKVRLLIDGENYSSGHIEFTDEDYLTYNEKYKTLGVE